MPDWAKITPSPSINTPPQEVRSYAPALTAQRVGVIGGVLLDLFLAQIALALGNVTVLGVKPFAFLSEWGRDLQEKASEAYIGAGWAQSSANWANAQLTILTGGSLASDVVGGVAVNDQFNGASANNLGASFTLKSSDGPGAGEFGLSGTGQAVWKESGGNRRRKIFQHNTALNTDYQSVFTLISGLPQKSRLLGSDAFTYLCGRMNSAGTTFIYAYIAYDTVGIGKCVGGTFTDLDDVSITLSAGDQITLLLGTDTDDCQFIVKQNGVQKLSVTETTSFGSDYRYAGVGAQATARTLFFDQTVPAELEMWAASDRLATTV
jgi:hypothetical protein